MYRQYVGDLHGITTRSIDVYVHVIDYLVVIVVPHTKPTFPQHLSHLPQLERGLCFRFKVLHKSDTPAKASLDVVLHFHSLSIPFQHHYGNLILGTTFQLQSRLDYTAFLVMILLEANSCVGIKRNC